MKNNKGLSIINIVLVVILILGLSYFSYFFYKKYYSVPKAESTLKKYETRGFLKFNLPPVNEEQINEFLKNPENSKCYKKEYFKGPNWTSNAELSLLTFTANEDPLCLGAPGPYSSIELRFYTKNFFGEFNRPEFHTWILDTNLSNDKMEVFKNTNSYQSIGRDYFMIKSKNPNQDSFAVISINPGVDEKHINYLYVLDLIKSFEIRELKEFEGTLKCSSTECKNMEITTGYENVGLSSNPLAKEAITHYKIIFNDLDSGNQYYKFVHTSRDLNTSSFVGKMYKINENIIFDYTYVDYKIFNQVSKITKIAILNLKTGEIKDVFTKPDGGPLQDFLVSGDDIYFVIGSSCTDGGCEDKNFKKYIFKYNFNENKVSQLTNKSFKELGMVEVEELTRVEVLKVQNNKLYFLVASLIQPDNKYFTLDLSNNSVSYISQAIGTAEIIKKEKELGIQKMNNISIKKGILVESIVNQN